MLICRIPKQSFDVAKTIRNGRVVAAQASSGAFELLQRSTMLVSRFTNLA